jgi:MFS family permease
VVLLGISVWIRLSLHESPAFQRMKAAGTESKAPLRETFGEWRNVKLVLIALLGLTAGQATVWYSGQFYSLFFLTQTLKVDGGTANMLLGIFVLLTTPLYVICGALSDRVGRKPMILLGCLLAALTYMPIFKGLTHYANPMLAAAQERAPVTVTADPATCSFQFNPVGTAQFTSSCDIAKSFLTRHSVNYRNEPAPPGSIATVRIGDITVPSFEGGAMDKAVFRQYLTAFDSQMKAVVSQAGYPAKADPTAIDKPMIVLLLTLLGLYSAMTYGPIAAALVEMFPTRIRYTSMSLPYHIGNGWFGGFLPATVFAIVAATGNIYSGLWYPVVIAAMSLVIGLIFLPETKDRDITQM